MLPLRQQGKGGGRPWLGPLQGRSATTRPSIGAAGCGQGPYRGCRRGSRPWPACKGRRSPATRLQGQRLPTAHRGAAYGYGVRPPARCRPRAAAPIVGVVANGTHTTTNKGLFYPFKFEKL
ncbi:hypothetical protein BHE74_00056389 [Ensete ventricosum]|nr:hypothetical protein BHE74_00056389 [Ensete ventricosum]